MAHGLGGAAQSEVDDRNVVVASRFAAHGLIGLCHAGSSLCKSPRCYQLGPAAREPCVEPQAPGQFRSPRIKALLHEGEKDEKAAPGDKGADDDTGEVLFVVGYGRVAHKIPNRIPIGLALTYFAGSIQPHDAAAANKLAAQGLVTWINFPSLAPGRGKWDIPGCQLDGRYVQLEEAVDVDREVRTEWKKIEGKIIVSAITRLIARAAVGQGIQTAAGRDNIIGILASLGTQATLTALDTPDTRSWETLPARVAVARMRLPPGRHTVVIDARGWKRTQDVVVEKNSWQVVSLMALR